MARPPLWRAVENVTPRADRARFASIRAGSSSTAGAVAMTDALESSWSRRGQPDGAARLNHRKTTEPLPHPRRQPDGAASPGMPTGSPRPQPSRPPGMASFFAATPSNTATVRCTLGGAGVSWPASARRQLGCSPTREFSTWCSTMTTQVWTSPPRKLDSRLFSLSLAARAVGG